MKKKLLTVLLSAVMIFGVFAFTGCNSSNPADDYNYYSSVYSSLKDEADIRLHAITYTAFERMFVTPGTFLVYVGNHKDAGADEDMKKVNDLAKEYNVQVYHFDPVLDGGVKSKDAGQKTMDLRDTDANLKASATALYEMKELILQVANAKTFPVGFMAISGAAVTYPMLEAYKEGDTIQPKYNGSVLAASTDRTKFEMSVLQARGVAQKKPSYAKPENHRGGEAGGVGEAKNDDLTSAAYDASNINTFDLFNDYRLHMAGDFDTYTSAYTAETTHLFVAITYHGFLDLLTNNQGYFAVFFGGTWCGNTQAIAKLTSDMCKDHGMKVIYMFDPRWDNGVKLDIATVGEDENGNRVLNIAHDELSPFDGMNSRASELTCHRTCLEAPRGKDGKIISDVLANTFSEKDNMLVRYNDETGHSIPYSYVSKKGEAGKPDEVQNVSVSQVGEFVATGAEVTSYFLVTTATDAAKNVTKTYKLVDSLNYDHSDKTLYPDDNGKTGAQKVTYTYDVQEMTGTRYTAQDAENFNYLYAYLLDNYLTTYVSYWNYGTTITIGGKPYCQMAVPNIMMFNGEGDGVAKLVGYAEAEYDWGIQQQVTLWNNALRELMEKNPYAIYNPVIVTETPAAQETSSSESASSSAPAAPAAAAEPEKAIFKTFG